MSRSLWKNWLNSSKGWHWVCKPPTHSSETQPLNQLARCFSHSLNMSLVFSMSMFSCFFFVSLFNPNITRFLNWSSVTFSWLQFSWMLCPYMFCCQRTQISSVEIKTWRTLFFFFLYTHNEVVIFLCVNDGDHHIKGPMNDKPQSSVVDKS